MHSKRIVTIQKLGKRELANRLVDLGGMTQQQADEAIQAVHIAIGTWIEAMVRSLPEGTRAEILFSKLGVLEVTHGITFKPGSGNRTRRRLHLPLVPRIEVQFRLCEELHEYISRINRQARTIRNSKLPRGKNLGVMTNRSVPGVIGEETHTAV